MTRLFQTHLCKPKVLAHSWCDHSKSCCFALEKDVAQLFLFTLEFKKLIPCEKLPLRIIFEQLLVPFANTNLLPRERGSGHSLCHWKCVFLEIMSTQIKIFSRFTPPAPSVSVSILHLFFLYQIVPIIIFYDPRRRKGIFFFFFLK